MQKEFRVQLFSTFENHFASIMKNIERVGQASSMSVSKTIKNIRYTTNSDLYADGSSFQPQKEFPRYQNLCATLVVPDTERSKHSS